jgi:Spy/CpxP family protein refolding chaperone
VTADITGAVNGHPMRGRNTPVIVYPERISTMASHLCWALAALLASGTLALSAGSTVRAEQVQQTAPQNRPAAQPEPRREGHDRRLWWKDPKDMAEIGLTATQSAEIDRIFRAEIEKMKPMRELITEMERGVDATSRANTADIEAYARQVRQVEHKRAELNTARTVMLYRMRRVLNAEQNVKLQALYDRLNAERKKQDAERRH